MRVEHLELGYRRRIKLGALVNLLTSIHRRSSSSVGQALAQQVDVLVLRCEPGADHIVGAGHAFCEVAGEVGVRLICRQKGRLAYMQWNSNEPDKADSQ